MVTFNLADLFESVVDTAGDRIALIAGEARLSYRQLDERANRLAHWLSGRGIGTGDKVGIYAHNRAEWVEAMWAAFKIRAVPININYRYVADELAYILDDADIKALLFERHFTPLVTATAATAPMLELQVVIDDGSNAPASGSCAVDYEQAISEGSPTRGFPDRSGDDLYLLYTGGTTGMPKGTMWRHEDIFFAALQGGNPGGAPIGSATQLREVVAGNRHPYAALCPAPMMHGGGMWYCMMYQLSGNCFVLYTGRRFDADRVLEIVEAEKIINLIVVGDAMARPLADAIASGRHDTSSLAVIGSGGAILSKSVKNVLRALLPNTMIFDSFGASETGSGGMVMDLDQSEAAGPRFTLSAGTAVLDDELQPVEPGSDTIGMLAKSGHIPLGYYKDETKTAATFRTDANGVRWVLPGDFARVLADGTVELLGRGSVCINSGGEKIYPEEVEAALKAHPAVFDAGVVGVADERFGQKTVAIVRFRPGQRAAFDDIVTFCRTKIAGYKCPRELIVVDEIPRTPAAKPDYRKLKALAQAALGIDE